MRIITKSEQETHALAKNFAKTLIGGETIGLVGDLGAGKTVFTKGLAAGLGVYDTVNSPTFVLMKVYKIKNKKIKIKVLVHLDAYRIKKAEEISSVGLEDYLDQPDKIVVIEWPKNINSLLPKNTILINIKNLSANKREITIK
jgi:tRNA threonylcarbamoyladenosine biosynthesis protein TsaE